MSPICHDDTRISVEIQVCEQAGSNRYRDDENETPMLYEEPYNTDSYT